MFSICVVDDERIITDGILEMVCWDELGIDKVSVFNNPLECLDILTHTEILFTDIVMPQMDGLDLVQKAKQLNPEIKIIICSAYDDFKYVYRALKLGAEDYLLKPLSSERLVSTLSAAIEKIQKQKTNNININADANLFTTNLLNMWITNSIMPTELKDRAGFINLPLNNKEYIVVAFKTFYTTNNTRRLNNALNIIGSIKSTLAPYFQYLVFNNPQQEVILIINNEITNRFNELKHQIDRCVRMINSYYNIDLYICIGEIVIGYENVCKSYKTAMKSFDYCMVFQPNRLVAYDMIEKLVSDGSFYHRVDEDLIAECIEKENGQQFTDYLDVFFNTMSEKKDVTFADLQFAISYILFSLCKCFKINLYGLPYANNLNIDTSCKDISIVKYKITQLFCNMLKTHKNEESCFSPIVKRAIQYVNANYSKDISIKTLSTELNINPSYFGQLFKAETGHLFTDYLNNLRIKKAVALIHSTNQRVSEISYNVGYNNTTYFFRIFKKIVGMSPTEYKAQML